MRARHERHAHGLEALARRIVVDGPWTSGLAADIEAELLEVGYFEAAARRARVLARRAAR